MKISNRIFFLILTFFSLSTLFLKAETSVQTKGNSELYYFKAEGENAKGKTVVILPGGGYVYHAMDHEGFDWVPFFNNLGINVAILKYKLPEGDYNIPLNDVKETFRALRENAHDLNVNPEDIGIMGFSAGGHLASSYATHSSEEKPAFQILFYPVISMKSSLTHPGSRDNLLGENPTEEMVVLFSNEEQINPDTPPAIIFHSDDDGLVVPENSINYYLGLNQHKIPASLHIYPSGEHGWGFRESFPYHEAMLKELETWLSNLNLK